MQAKISEPMLMPDHRHVIESGKMEIKPELVNCQEVLDEVSAMLRSLAQAKGLPFDVIVPILIPSMCDGSIPIFPRWISRVARRSPQGCINQSRSGDGRCAGLERGMQRAEMRELGAGGQVQKLDRLRQLQQRRCGEQEIVGQRENGADRAVGGWPIGIVIGRLLCGFGGCLLRG